MNARLTLFGSYFAAEGPLSAKSLIFCVGPTRKGRGVSLHGVATVSAEGLFAAAPATARFALRRAALECHAELVDGEGTPWRLDVAWRPSRSLVRALTELAGTLTGPDGAVYAVRLRVNWRIVRRRR